MLAFRTATSGDANAIVQLVNSAYRGDSSRRGWTTEADLLGGQRTDPEKVSEMIQLPHSRIELAESDDGGLLGCVSLEREPAGACYLGMLTVDPTRQAAGIGKLLLGHSEAIARQWGCEAMRMTVIHLREELLRYYERQGYRRTGATEPFPENDPRFGLPKISGLMFLELLKPLG
jgi:GNAT superfamily N-acetyltransferase